MKQVTTVADGTVVSLDYVLRLESGEEVDRSDRNKPLEFLQGHGHIIAGLESALYGMAIGDSKRVVVTAADGYGEYDPDEVADVPRSAFPDDLEPEAGSRLHVRDSDSGELYEAKVLEVKPNAVVLDFNHPLAGKTLHFDISIAGLRAATADELAHGHVHGPDHAH